jgi:hypothetical protein
MSLRIVDGFIELKGERVAGLLPGVRPSLVFQLTSMFDSIDEDEGAIAELENQLGALKAKLARAMARLEKQ